MESREGCGKKESLSVYPQCAGACNQESSTSSAPSGLELRHDFLLSGLDCSYTPRYFLHLWARETGRAWHCPFSSL